MANKNNPQKITIDIPGKGNAPVFHLVEGQLQPQQAYIEINPVEKTVTADFIKSDDSESNKPFWLGHVIRIPIHPATSRSALEQLRTLDEFQKFVSTIINNHKIKEYDGELRGWMSEDAFDAENSLRDIADNLEKINISIRI